VAVDDFDGDAQEIGIIFGLQQNFSPPPFFAAR
jgi:hypothetical protein